MIVILLSVLMVVDIRSITNNSDRTSIFFNSENIANSFSIIPSADPLDTNGLWISYHRHRPLIISTRRGILRVWDDNYRILGQWEGADEVILMLDVNGNARVNATINPDGSVAIVFIELFATQHHFYYNSNIRYIDP